MGKNSESRTKVNKDGDTKVLFKKSNATMFSHSRTFSEASQLYSRSGIMQIRKNLETNQQNYYTDRGKVKRDLSVETDVCILRRYYRNKKNSLLGANSAKSRFSTLVDTECETIEEYPDTSACGDNDTEKSNQPFDIASLMIDNLKDLLNQWIQKHLIENKDTKQKIDTVLDSLIQKLEPRNNHPSSSVSTYILHKEAGKQEVKNKKVATASLTCQYCKHKPRYVNVGSSAAESSMSQKRSSGLTITPFHYKDIRIISTLSIPRSFHKRGLEEKNEQNNSWYRMKKIKHKNLILSIHRSNKFINTSSFDLVAISTKSLTKRTNNDTISKKKKRHIVFYPKPFYKSTTDTSITHGGNLQINNIDTNKAQLEAMPSLLKSLYANDPIMPDKNIQYGSKSNNSTMTEKKSNEITVSNSTVTTEIAKDIHVKQTTEEFLSQENENKPFVAQGFTECRIEFANPEKSSSTIPKNSRIKIENSRKKTSRGKINKPRKRQTFHSIHNKRFSYLYKKANTSSQMPPGGEFVKHCQNIMQYFEEFKNKNIKLDIQINVYPTYQCNAKDVCTDISNQGINDVKFKPTLLYNIQSTQIDASVHMDEEPINNKTESENYSNEFTPKIIPLFDSSVCQAKYIFKVNSKEKLGATSKPNSFIERSTLTSELEIVQEISELRAVIKDLAAAAEKFVNEQLKREANKSNAETNISRNPSNYTSSSKVEAVINLRNPSKAIQYSKEIIEKQKLLSGLKITKEPKKKETFDFYNRLVKKSTSYRIIDSESILRVTDMTSKANELNETPYNRENPQTNDVRNSRVNKVAKEALPSSVPKSKSLFEITSEQAKKDKLAALYYDNYQKDLQCRVCSVHCNRSPTCSSYKSCRKFGKLFSWAKKKGRETDQQQGHMFPPCFCGSYTPTNCSDSMHLLNKKCPMGGYGYSSTIVFPLDNADQNAATNFREDEQTATQNSMEEDQMRLPPCKVRRGMGFGEGCVYCLLLWIPIILLCCLFYVYVLKDKIKPNPARSAIGRQGQEIKRLSRRSNSSVLYMKLSDLGF